MKLISYIKGDKHSRAAHDLEREAMSDPLLGDALDGLDSVAWDHMATIERLRAGVRARSRRRRRVFVLRTAGIAASLLLCVGLGVYMFDLDRRSPDMAVALFEQQNTEYKYAEPAEQDSAQYDLEKACDPKMAYESKPDARRNQSIGVEIRDIQNSHTMDYARPLNIVMEDAAVSTGAVHVDQNNVEAPAVSVAPAMPAVSSLPVAPAMPAVPSLPVASAAPAKTIVVTGVVTDRFQNPLSGAVVVVDGTSKGVATNAHGAYSITVKTGQHLVFSYLGCSSQMVAVSGPVVDVALADDNMTLNEVVVTGYASAKRIKTTGASSTGVLVAEKTGRSKSKRDTAVVANGEPKSSGDSLLQPVSTVCFADCELIADDICPDTRPSALPSAASPSASPATSPSATSPAASPSASPATSPAASPSVSATVPAQPPTPVGGMQKYMKYLRDNVSAAKQTAHGKVVLTFMVDATGTPFDIRVTNSLNPACDAIAKRLIEEGPKWILSPARVRIDVEF